MGPLGGFWPKLGRKRVTAWKQRSCVPPGRVKTNKQTVGQLYGLPHGILHVFNTILYENEFQNPQIFQQTISLFPKHSTLEGTQCM
jgi:hypothetical protein